MTQTTGEIERNAERTRSDLSATLDEIRGRMEPSHLVDRAFSYARSNGGSDFVRNAASQARDNPLPILLIGAGIAWLMSGRQPGSGPSVGALQGSAMRGSHDARDAVSGLASAVGDAVSAAAGGVRDAVASGKSGVRDASSRVSGMTTSTSDGLQSGAAQVQSAFGQLQRLCVENPIAAGAIGVAIGAAIGAAFPTTETESRLMGAQADDLKATLKAKADEGMERGQRAVQAGLEEAKSEPSKPSSADSTRA